MSNDNMVSSNHVNWAYTFSIKYRNRIQDLITIKCNLVTTFIIVKMKSPKFEFKIKIKRFYHFDYNLKKKIRDPIQEGWGLIIV